MILEASAPGRCGIIGNPSDIYGGFVVSCSVPVRARCWLTMPSVGTALEDTRLWEAALNRFPVDGSVEWETGIPRSSGLSGSTALLAATLLCVLGARGEAAFSLDSEARKAAFAELLRDVEFRDAGITCGYQDAYMIVHGGLNALDFAGKHPLDGGPTGVVVPLDAPLPGPNIAGRSGHEPLPFLLVTTGVERHSGSVHRPMLERWLAGDSGVRQAILEVAELGRKGVSALVGERWAELGELMDANQAITASLGGSGDEVDALVSAARSEGAVAAKLAGAGKGGTIIALTLEADELEARLRKRGYTRFLRPSIEPGLRWDTK